MSKIYLLIPYELKEELKANEKISWDSNRKLWFCNQLTDGLKKYELFMADIPYDDKDRLKAELKSMKWLGNEKVWAINRQDYVNFYGKEPV